MFRTDWEIVSPTSWLTDFVDEEAFVSGRDVDLFGQPTAATMLIFLPETTETQQGQTQRQEVRRGGRRNKTKQQKQQQRHAQGQGKDDNKPAQSPTSEAMETEPEAESTQRDKAKRSREMLLREDFFVDLPLGARAFETRMPANAAPPTAKTKDGYAYMTYAYSACATLDDAGETIESTRRRYEDSSGVMKAVHRRQIGDRALESMWLKTSETDKGKHEKRVEAAGDNAQDFERAWRATPFGIAEKHALAQGEKNQTELPDATPAPEIP